MAKKHKYKKEDRKIILNLYSTDKNISSVAKKYCKEKGIEYTDSYRRYISKILYKEGENKNKLTLEQTEDFKLAKKRKLNTKKCYIVAYEQNNTPLHDNLFDNILAYAKKRDAEISVILGRYKNPTSIFSDKKYDTWNERTRPYWDAKRHDIHKYLTILSDVKVQPTAVSPLTSMESITGNKTCIVGHPKLHIKPVPVLEGYPKKFLFTTGAITKPNYTDSKAGKKSESKHKLGFVIVEIKDKDVFFIRQVEADKKGNFIDLFYKVEDGKVYENKSAKALVWGDTHIGSLNEKVEETTYKLIKKLNIKQEIHHDLADGESVNNHIVKNPVEQFQRYKEGNHLITEEIEKIKAFLNKSLNIHKVIVQSNHNDRFDRWIINHDWKKDIPNALEYLKYSNIVLEGKAPKGILAYILEEEFKDKITCLGYDESYKIGGVELAHHGHIGANGSRGSLTQFSKLNTPVVIAHSHSPGRIDDAIQVGTSTHLRLGYNKGASDWANSHAILHDNNKVQQIIFVKGEFTTLKV